ncbi:outer membrane efflux protein [Chitinispirillum alkaliphilum]|nr:outer membrane efflux protein [Chitinispirillum alkaliphilum]
MMKKPVLYMLFSIFLSFQAGVAEHFLTLPEAEQRGLQNNYQLLISQFEQESARWERYSALASFLPNVSFSTNWIQAEDIDIPPPNGTPGEIGVPGAQPGLFAQDGFQHQLSVTQPIFNSGAEIVSTLMAKNTLSALRHRVEETKQDMLLQIRSLYLNAIILKEQMRIDSLGLQWVEGSLERARIRFEEGVLPESELLRWQGEVFERRADIAQSRVNAQSALVQLLFAIGEPVTRRVPFELQDKNLLQELYGEIQPPSPVSVEENPSVLAAREELSVSRRTVQLALTPFLPRINAFFQYDWLPDDNFFPQEEGFWRYGIRMDLDLFAGGQRYFDYRAARNQHTTMETTYQQLLENTRASVLETEMSFESAVLEVEAARSRLELMEKTLEMMELRYEAGVVGILDLLDTRVQLESAEMVYLSGMANAIINRYEFERAAGTLKPFPNP